MTTKFIKSVSLISALAAFSLTSCDKEISKDEPLPVDFKPSVFFSSNNRILFSVDVATNKTNWEFVADAAVKASPTIFKNSVILATTGGKVYKINKITGILEQEIDLNVPIIATPTVYNDKLIICTTDGRMIAYNGNDLYGDIYWTNNTLGQILGSPNVNRVGESDITGIIGANANNEVFVINEEDGNIVWRKTMTPAGAIANAVSANENTIYAASTNGRLYSLRTTDGNVNWTYTTLGPITASPTSIGGNVMIGSADMNFYSVDSLNGTLRWKVKAEDKIESSAAYDNQFVYFGSNDKHVYCVDIINGLDVWKRRTGSVVISSPVVYNNKVYVQSYDKNLYILDSETGKVDGLIETTGQADCSPVLQNLNNTYFAPVSGNYFLK